MLDTHDSEFVADLSATADLSHSVGREKSKRTRRSWPEKCCQAVRDPWLLLDISSSEPARLVFTCSLSGRPRANLTSLADQATCSVAFNIAGQDVNRADAMVVATPLYTRSTAQLSTRRELR